MIVLVVIGALAIGLIFAFFCRWLAGDGLDRILKIFSLYMPNAIKDKTNNADNQSNSSNNTTPIFIGFKRYFKIVCKLFTPKYSNHNIGTKNSGIAYKNTFNNAPDISIEKLPHNGIIESLKQHVKNKKSGGDK